MKRKWLYSKYVNNDMDWCRQCIETKRKEKSERTKKTRENEWRVACNVLRVHGSTLPGFCNVSMIKYTKPKELWMTFYFNRPHALRLILLLLVLLVLRHHHHHHQDNHVAIPLSWVRIRYSRWLLLLVHFFSLKIDLDQRDSSQRHSQKIGNTLSLNT